MFVVSRVTFGKGKFDLTSAMSSPIVDRARDLLELLETNGCRGGT
jgi:hypothetical protein